MQQTHILVVDDDTDICASLELLFTKEGYHVDVVHDGRAALTRLVTTPYPLIVLLDIMMPTLDGVGVLEIVGGDRELRARHRFILMTALSRQLPAELEAMIVSSNLPMVRKPFDIQVMLQQVAALANGTTAQDISAQALEN